MYNLVLAYNQKVFNYGFLNVLLCGIPTSAPEVLYTDLFMHVNNYVFVTYIPGKLRGRQNGNTMQHMSWKGKYLEWKTEGAVLPLNDTKVAG